jgi:uncharacterized caspase-like protein
VANVLRTHQDGAPNFDCIALTALSGEPGIITRTVLRDRITTLFKDRADVALLHFSGHGTVNDLGGFLVTQDAERYDEGIPMIDVLSLANNSPVAEVVILLDCCYSGKLGTIPAIDNSKSLLREGVSILTASRGDQPSVETGGGGVFTSLVIDALEGGAANILGAVTAPAVYAFVEGALGAWDQRPLFKAHVSKVLELRRCSPPIDRTILRQLPALFPLPAEDRQLDPSYEPTSSQATAANIAIFGQLQALHRLHLVMPVDAAHMYDAAVNSTACRLTPSGRYYWRLANDRRI